MAAFAAGCALVGCDRSAEPLDAVPGTQIVDTNWQRYKAEVEQSVAANEALMAKEPAAPYSLVVFQGRAVHRDADVLDAVKGKGYPELRAFVYARGVPRRKSPVADVKPVCHSAAECEYLPPRQSGFAESFVVSLDGDAPVELRAEEDEVVIAAKSLAFAQPTVVTVTLTAPGVSRTAIRIVYAPPST